MDDDTPFVHIEESEVDTGLAPRPLDNLDDILFYLQDCLQASDNGLITLAEFRDSVEHVVPALQKLAA